VTGLSLHVDAIRIESRIIHGLRRFGADISEIETRVFGDERVLRPALSKAALGVHDVCEPGRLWSGSDVNVFKMTS